MALDGTGAVTVTRYRVPVDTYLVKAFVAHLFLRAYSLQCSTSAQVFAHLMQPVASAARFQLALDALLPRLDAGAVENVKNEKNGWES
ncbi:hypothetical protein JOM56_015607 [Amanita muscaria]